MLLSFSSVPFTRAADLIAESAIKFFESGGKPAIGVVVVDGQGLGRFIENITMGGIILQ